MQLYCYFVSQSSEFCRHNPLCCFSTNVYCCRCCLFRYRLSPETFGYTVVQEVVRKIGGSKPAYDYIISYEIENASRHSRSGIFIHESRDSSVSIATRLRAGRSGFYGSIPGVGWDFFSSLPCPERLWTHTASYPVGTGGSFPGGKSAGV
jgi:hypothetical protein